MDEDALTHGLKCDIELNFTGPSGPVVNKWAADVLRRLAERIEKDEFEDGFHEVKDSVGKPVGEIYLDFTLMDNV